MGIEFLHGKPPILTMEIKKPRGLRPTNLNPLYEIKLHRFTWLFYPKELLFNTYNLNHIHDVATSNCSNEYSSALSKDEGLQTKIQISNP